MELAVLRRVALELDQLIFGAFVSKVHQPLPREIVLRVRSRDLGEKKLVLSADPGLGRIHVTDLKIPNPPSPPRFCAFLRAHFQGSRIVSVKCTKDDRVLRITAVRGPEERRVERDLVLELLGRDSNILLIDNASNRIMDCLHNIAEKEQRSRIVMPGCEYVPPPRGQQQRHTPFNDEQLLKVRPGLRTTPDGKRHVILDADPSTDQCFDTINEALDTLYSTRLQSELLEAFRRDVRGPVKTRIQALERRIDKIRADEQRLKTLAERIEEGELLKGNLHRVRKGMDRLEVEDWSTGRPRTIMLDPALDGVANMEFIFTKAAKGKRGERKVRQRMEETLSEKQALEDQLFFIEHADSIEDLERLASETNFRENRTRRRFQRKKTDPTPGTSMFHEFQSPSGRLVFVGRSGKGNDFLLRHKAKADDLWFHVKSGSGAHVLLPKRTQDPVTAEDVEYAASLAVRFSKARGTSKIEVMVATVKDLDRPKRALPGQVTVRHYQTIVAASEESAKPNIHAC